MSPVAQIFYRWYTRRYEERLDHSPWLRRLSQQGGWQS